MEITINLRRVLVTSMMGFMALMMAIINTGCGAYGSNAKSRSTMVVDDGITPVRRVEVTHEGNTSGASIGLPIVAQAAGGGFVGGFGPYGQPVVAGGNLCTIHPDYCGTVVTVATPVPQGSVPAPVAQGSDPELESRVTKLEKTSELHRQVLIRDMENRKIVLGTLDSALMLNPSSCAYITANPDTLVVDGDPELTTQVRAGVLTKCRSILAADKENK